MAVKHSWLPQITADYNYLINELDNEAVGYKLDKFKPEDIKPLTDNINTSNVEGLKDSITNLKPITPIILSKDNEVLDGHDRLHAFKTTPNIVGILCIKLYLDKHEASRILNKIEDKFNWENSLDGDFNVKMDENVLEEPKNAKTLKLYSNKGLTKNPFIGNTLVHNKTNSYNIPYELEFENLYEMSDEECGENPIVELGKKWFGGDYDNFKVEAAKSCLTFENYLLKKLHKEAFSKGYDGIQYGSKFVQTVDSNE